MSRPTLRLLLSHPAHFLSLGLGSGLSPLAPGGIVWDEFVAMWLVLWLAPAGLWWQVASFVLFRIFDIVKPWPIRIADTRFKNGFGVMFDDLLAAGYSLLCLSIAVHIL